MNRVERNHQISYLPPPFLLCVTPIKTDSLTESPLIEVAVKRKKKKPRRKHERKIRKINEASLLDDWGQEDLNGAVERGDPCKIRGREKLG